jgi:hypothetical protein
MKWYIINYFGEYLEIHYLDLKSGIRIVEKIITKQK